MSAPLMLHVRVDSPQERLRPTRSWWHAVRGGVLIGAPFGLLEGALVALGVDPALFVYEARVQGIGAALARDLPRLEELPALMSCVLASIAVFALLGVITALALRVVAAISGLVTSRGRRVSLDVGVATCAMALWIELAWWARPFFWPGSPINDPRRLVALVLLTVPAALLAVVAARVWRGRSALTRSVARGALVAAAATGSWFAFVPDVASERRGSIGPLNGDQSNVLLVVVDALRYDVLSHERSAAFESFRALQTPNLDAFARDGVTFERALAHAPFTWPSFGSLLTGKLPRRHGLVRMTADAALPENATLGELLAGPRVGGVREPPTGDDSAWLRAAFMTGALSQGSGLLRGFDVYSEAMAGRGLVDAHDRWSTFRAQLLPWLVASKLAQHAREGSVVSLAAEWLELHRDQRFFALVHLYATHTPYDPPAELRARHVDPGYRGVFTTFDAAHRQAIERGELVPIEADIAQIRALYAACVEEVDEEIGVLLRALERAGIAKETLVIVTSDHGESLGERRLFEHGWMTQENLRVPLLMRWPGRMPAGLRVAARVEHVDVLPTVLALVGVVAPPNAADRGGLAGEGAIERAALIDGVSLVPLLRAQSDSMPVVERSISYAEDGELRAAQDDRTKVVVGVRRWPFEVVRAGGAPTSRSPRYAIFDLVADPGERAPLVFDARPRRGEARSLTSEVYDVIEALHALEERIPERSPAPAPRATQHTTERRLRALGY